MTQKTATILHVLGPHFLKQTKQEIPARRLQDLWKILLLNVHSKDTGMITLHTFLLIYFGDHRMKALWIVCTQLSISRVNCASMECWSSVKRILINNWSIEVNWDEWVWIKGRLRVLIGTRPWMPLVQMIRLFL